MRSQNAMEQGRSNAILNDDDEEIAFSTRNNNATVAAAEVEDNQQDREEGEYPPENMEQEEIEPEPSTSDG